MNLAVSSIEGRGGACVSLGFLPKNPIISTFIFQLRTCKPNTSANV
jgi:hypothetical protein